MSLALQALLLLQLQHAGACNHQSCHHGLTVAPSRMVHWVHLALSAAMCPVQVHHASTGRRQHAEDQWLPHHVQLLPPGWTHAPDQQDQHDAQQQRGGCDGPAHAALVAREANPQLWHCNTLHVINTWRRRMEGREGGGAAAVGRLRGSSSVHCKLICCCTILYGNKLAAMLQRH